MAEEKTLTAEELAQKEADEAARLESEGADEGSKKEPPQETPEEEAARLKSDLVKANAWNAKQRIETKRMQERLAALESKKTEGEVADYEKGLDGIEDDGFVPGKTFKETVKQMAKTERERTLREAQAYIPVVKRQIRAEMSLERAMDKHDGSDGNLSMQDMTGFLKDKLTEEDALEITESKDPAETAYQIGLRYHKAAVGGNGGGTPAPKKKPTQLRGGPGGGKSLTEEDVQNKIANWEKLKPEERDEIRRML